MVTGFLDLESALGVHFLCTGSTQKVHWECTFLCQLRKALRSTCAVIVYYAVHYQSTYLCYNSALYNAVKLYSQCINKSLLGVYFKSTEWPATLWNYQGTGQYFLTKISTLKPLTIPVFSVAFVVPTEQLPVGAIRSHFSLYRKKRYALFLIGSGTGGRWRSLAPLSPLARSPCSQAHPSLPAQPLEQLLLAFCGVAVKGQNR